ncbi:hypothetical protein [Stenotrophomonas sp. PS02301]|uniref:hypothetical protein n=1 Tax=Stenotrophomonas sp. PS02301 TaxID=2991427 RepID=UPI00249BBFF6|nr:hypothetical protein [Stenotrophomonas sp. PS02301]
MSAVILSFTPSVRCQRAAGAFAAVNIAARRMGYAEHLAYRAARLARNEVLEGKKSAARAVADMKADLSLAARDDGPAAA